MVVIERWVLGQMSSPALEDFGTKTMISIRSGMTLRITITMIMTGMMMVEITILRIGRGCHGKDLPPECYQRIGEFMVITS
jgi:hypothetical protein